MAKYKGKPYRKYLTKLPSTADAEYPADHAFVLDLSRFG